MVVYLIRVRKPDSFVQLYLLFMVLKFLAYGAFVFILILKDKAGAEANALFFMATYFIFTALEVVFLFFRKERESPP